MKIPSKTMGEQWIVCQSIGVARRYGWAIAVGKEDVICRLAIPSEFRRPNDEYLRGFASVGMYCKDEQAAINLEASAWRFEPGTYGYVCVAPLNRTTFEAHVRCDVHQQRAGFPNGSCLALLARRTRVSTSGGRLDCAEIVIQTLTTNEPKVVLPCTGDRVFGMAQDDEMAFVFPWAYAHEIIKDLEGTHKGGTRYPITVAMPDTVTMPESYH